MVELVLAFFVRRNAFLRAKFMLTTFQKCVHDWDLDWYRNGSAGPVFQVCFWHVCTYFVWYSEVLYSVIPFGNLPFQTKVTTSSTCPLISRSAIWRFTLYSYKRVSSHFVKSVQIRSFFWSIFSCIQSGYRKIWTRKISVFWLFSHSVWWYLL